MDSMFFVPSDSNGAFAPAFPSEPGKRRAEFGEDDEWSLFKMGKADQTTAETSKPALFLLRSNSSSSSPNGEKMLSFSSPRPDSAACGALPFYQYPSPLSVPSSSSAPVPSYLKNTGMLYGSSNMGINGVRGAFTPNQWMELEQQALIYKYIDAKMPVPSSLVIPIRRSVGLYGFHSFTSGSCRPGTLRCGPYNIGFAGNADPEPGRCRRTDGKKWRCSRDAVGDQKYCERHINRGRHRSRKHVEGHNGHAEKAAMPVPSQSASAVSGGSSSNLTVAQQLQGKGLQPGLMKSSPVQFDRILMNTRNGGEQARDSQNTLFPIFQKPNPFEEIPSNSNPDKKTFAPVPETHPQPSKSHPLLHFIDDWPKKNDMLSDRTQLSISTPMDTSDYSLSPIRLVRESDHLEDHKRHSGCIPVSWEDPMIGGGPLGEVLTKKSRVSEDLNVHRSSSPLDFLAGGWDSGARLDSSPTGVLQKNCCFVSLSGSTGSSPRAERQA